MILKVTFYVNLSDIKDDLPPPWYWTCQWLWNDDFFNWIPLLSLRVCLAEIKCYKSTE